jgi:hypothetical protein
VLPVLARDVVLAGMRPTAILAAGAGAAVGILIGQGIIGAVTLAVLAWVVAVAVPVGRRHAARRGPGVIDPFSLREPWRQAVQEALQAQSRFRQATTGVAAGPLRDRLTSIGAQLERGVLEAGQVARRGQQLQDVRRQIDTAAILSQLERIEADAAQGWAAGSGLERTADALRSQLATAERLDGVLEETRIRLGLLDARLDEAVARSLELSVRSGDVAELGGVDTDVGEVIEEMEALRLALDETDGGPALPPP